MSRRGSCPLPPRKQQYNLRLEVGLNGRDSNSGLIDWSHLLCHRASVQLLNIAYWIPGNGITIFKVESFTSPKLRSTNPPVWFSKTWRTILWSTPDGIAWSSLSILSRNHPFFYCHHDISAVVPGCRSVLVQESNEASATADCQRSGTWTGPHFQRTVRTWKETAARPWWNCCYEVKLKLKHLSTI